MQNKSIMKVVMVLVREAFKGLLDISVAEAEGLEITASMADKESSSLEKESDWWKLGQYMQWSSQF